MKKIFVFLTFLIAAQSATAQLFTKEKVANNIDNLDQKFLSWGYFLGFNQYDFKFEYEENLDDIVGVVFRSKIAFNPSCNRWTWSVECRNLFWVVVARRDRYCRRPY